MGQALARDLSHQSLLKGSFRQRFATVTVIQSTHTGTSGNGSLSANLSNSIALMGAERRGAEVKFKLKHVLPLSLVIACSFGNPFGDLPVTYGETKAAESTEKSEPKRLPWYSSPLEMRQSQADSPRVRRKDPRLNEHGAQTPVLTGPVDRPSPKTSSAQSIPSAVKPSRSPVVRQVAAPGSQNQQYQNQQYQQYQNAQQSSQIQQQLDALYREKGLDAPVMSYDALPVQGVEDYQAMQAAQPQQAGAAPQNNYRVNSAQQASNQSSTASQGSSWLQKLFGRRPKNNEQAEQQPPAANMHQQPQGMPNQYPNGQYQNGQNSNAQSSNNQYQNNQYQNQPQQQQQQQFNQQQYGNQQQYNSVQQEQQNNQSFVNPSQAAPQQTTQQPRSTQPASQSRAANGLDYSRLKQSRAAQQQSAQATRQVAQPQQVAEEPEEALDFTEADSTPRLETNTQDLNSVESTDSTPTTPDTQVRQPSPFDNLELHTPEEPAAEGSADAEIPAENNNGENLPGESNDASGDSGSPTTQPGGNPLIVSENGHQNQFAQPIIGIDDTELAAKYRILAAFPELNGMKGFCPVVLRDQRDLLRAKNQYTSTYNNQQYQFSSSDAMLKFKQSPEKYLPIANGHDVVLLSEESAVVGTLDFAAWYHGRLYLFTGLENLETFVNNPAHYEGIALGKQPAADINEFEEPEESLEFEDPVSDVQSEIDSQDAAPANRSPADALRGPARPPAGDSSQEKINVPPPPTDAVDEDEIEMPGHQRPTARLSQKTRWKPVSRNIVER